MDCKGKQVNPIDAAGSAANVVSFLYIRIKKEIPINIIVIILILYLVVLLSVAVWSRRDSGSVEGYYVADKKIPFWVAAFSTNATGESGWLLLGLTGMGYLVGAHALWIALGEALGLMLSWGFIAKRLKQQTNQYESVTVPDYLASRFKDTRHILRALSIVIILTMVGIYTTAQMVAAGKAFGSFLEMDYVHGVLLGAAITMIYTAVGGFKAVAYTDLLQGVLMFLALLILPIVGIYTVGGLNETIDALGNIDTDLLDPFGKQGLSTGGVIAVASFLAIGLPILGVPQLMVRFISIRDEKEVYHAGAICIFVVLVFDIGAVLTGMTGRILFPGLEDAETIMPVMSVEMFHPVITGLLTVVVLAAIMSTVDSLLILASSAVVRDFIQKILQPDLSSEKLTRYGKLVTILIGTGAMLFAMSEAKVIFTFVLYAWSGLGAAFAPVLICALFWKDTTLAGAIAGMFSGFAVVILWILFFKESFYHLYEMVPGFITGLIITVVVSLLTRKTS